MQPRFRLLLYTEQSGAAPYVLAVAYLALLVFAGRKLHAARAQQTPGRWEPKALLFASAVFGCIVRVMAYVTMAVLSGYHLRLSVRGAGADDDDNDTFNSKHLLFYTRVAEVLFSVGDFVFLSAYLAVVVAWVETFQHTRRHFFSASSLKRKWLMLYLVLTTFAVSVCRVPCTVCRVPCAVCRVVSAVAVSVRRLL